VANGRKPFRELPSEESALEYAVKISVSHCEEPIKDRLRLGQESASGSVVCAPFAYPDIRPPDFSLV
jgi:hypothetical protein